MTDKEQTELKRLLRAVRDAGASDDNMGGEDWTFSDRAIDQARQALLDWRDKAVGERLREKAQLLQTKVTRYGDGEIAYHNGEATVPISAVLEALTQPGREVMTLTIRGVIK